MEVASDVFLYDLFHIVHARITDIEDFVVLVLGREVFCDNSKE